MNEPIRILQIVPSMRAAGIENFIMNLYRHIDRKKVQFDFVVHTKKREIYDDEIECLGGKIYRLTYKDDKNFLKYAKDLKRFFREHPEYKIIHGNMQSMMPVYLRIAKKSGVPVRIAHAHNSSYEKSVKGFILHILSRFAKYEATDRFACSKEAAQYLFGNRSFVFIPNAIDVNRFKFDQKKRNEIRRKLGIKDENILIGNIGRFDAQKNHKRIIEIFYDMSKNNNKLYLCLLGDGRLKNEIESLVSKLGLKKKVKFVGIQENTQDYLSAMDVFLFPSLYEGLPVTGIEAQTSGLSCIMSDSITKEVDITGQVKFLSLNDSDILWGETLFGALRELDKREMSYKIVADTDFNIERSAKRMEKLYNGLQKDCLK